MLRSLRLTLKIIKVFNSVMLLALVNKVIKRLIKMSSSRSVAIKCVAF